MADGGSLPILRVAPLCFAASSLTMMPAGVAGTRPSSTHHKTSSKQPSVEKTTIQLNLNESCSAILF